jgi:hypothetical protein
MIKLSRMAAQCDNDKMEKLIILLCKLPKTRDEIQNHIKIKNREYFRKYILNPFVKSDKLSLAASDIPSKNQKYAN